MMQGSPLQRDDSFVCVGNASFSRFRNRKHLFWRTRKTWISFPIKKKHSPDIVGVCWHCNIAISHLVLTVDTLDSRMINSITTLDRHHWKHLLPHPFHLVLCTCWTSRSALLLPGLRNRKWGKEWGWTGAQCKHTWVRGWWGEFGVFKEFLADISWDPGPDVGDTSFCWGYQHHTCGTAKHISLLLIERGLPLTTSDSSPRIALPLYTEQVQGVLQIWALGQGRWWNEDVCTVYVARAHFQMMIQTKSLTEASPVI